MLKSYSFVKSIKDRASKLYKAQSANLRLIKFVNLVWAIIAGCTSEEKSIEVFTKYSTN